MSRRILVLQRVLGGAYLLGGLGKFVPYDLAGPGGVSVQLNSAAAANLGTWLASPTRWLADHETVSIFASAIPMIVSGLLFILNRPPRWVFWAAVGQVVMILSFIVIFHRAFPFIFLVDPPFLAASTLIAVNTYRARLQGAGGSALPSVRAIPS